MFQNFANYLLGSVLSQNQEATAEEVDTSSIRITSTEENDWVLVDRDSEGKYFLNYCILRSIFFKRYSAKTRDKIGMLACRIHKLQYRNSTGSLTIIAKDFMRSFLFLQIL